MLNGIINVNKSAGFTSFDVVARLRSITHQKKIGHTGTLDPDATGVLPVCLGNATRVCSLLTDWDKCYRAKMRLGIKTDTQDISGNVTETGDASGISSEDIESAILSFVGSYDQIPPMYSAKKVDGKKLYELARKGVEVERKPCRVTIADIVIESIEPGVGAVFTVTCSKGTYIRTLCNDIGEKLGCGACMESLERTRVGCFDIKDALTLSEIEELFAAEQPEKIQGVLRSVDCLFEEYPGVKVKSGPGEKALMNGNILPVRFLEGKSEGRGMIRVYDPSGVFKALYKWDEKLRAFRSEKMFL